MRGQKLALVLFVCLAVLLAGCNIPTAVATQDGNVTTNTPVVVTETTAPAASTDTPVPQPAASDTPAASNVGPLTVTTENRYEETETPQAVIDIKYPVFTDASGNPVQGLNQEVQAFVDRQVSAFQGAVVQVTPPPDWQTGPNSLNVTYEVRYNEQGLVSIYFPISTYNQGAAHPLPWSETITYDVKNGRVMQLGDAFQPGTDYLTLLSQRSIADLQQQDRLHWEDGAKPLPENFKSWNLTPEGLHITFDPYQVTAYAAGFQNVVLPWSSLGEVLNPGLPFAGQ